MSMTW